MRQTKYNLPAKVNQLFCFALIYISLDNCNALPTPTTSSNIEKSVPPQISPAAEDITLEAGTNFMLRCESKEPIRWFYFNEENEGTTEKQYETQNPERPYGSEITLSNIDTNFVKYYYCIYDITQDITDEGEMEKLLEEGKASKIYVFVNDPNSLLALSSDYHNFYSFVQNSVGVVPCRPATKDVKVTLKYTGVSSEEKNSIHIYSDFDPYVGFKVKFGDVMSSYHFSCEAEKSDQSLSYQVEIVRKPESIVHSAKIIEEPENRHVVEDENFIIVCEIERSHGALLNAEWQHHNKKSIEAEKRWHESSETINSTLVRTKLVIHRAKKTLDSGEYRCIASNDAHKKQAVTTLKVLGADEYYIDLKEPTDLYKIEEKRGKKVQIVVRYKGHPKPEIEWLKPDQTKITLSDKSKCEVKTDDSKSVLSIKNSQLSDSGNYTVRAFNDKVDKALQFQVLIRSQPIVYFEDIHYTMVNQNVTLECFADAHPKPIITWTYIPCKIEPTWPNCVARSQIQLNEHAETFPHAKNLISYKSVLQFYPEGPGKVLCSATNILGVTVKETEIRIGDIAESVYIDNPADKTKIADGDEVTLTCSALAYNYTDSIVWFLNDKAVANSADIKITTGRSEYSYKTNLKFEQIKHANAGTYECRVETIDNAIESKYAVIEVHDPVDPILSDDSIIDGSVILKKIGESVELLCDVTECVPVPKILWFKDDEPLLEDDNIGIENGNKTLRVRFIRPKEDEGIYKCVISNRLGTVQRSTEVKVTDIPVGIHVGWIAAIIALILILLLFIIILCIRVYKDAQIRKQLKEIGIENFEEGCVGQINESMTLDEQAELLPYDKSRFEFPKEKIHLGKQLGQGAFGVVHKAICDGIKPDEKETVVAVKMVKKSADNEVIKALASELKIMAHMGQHLNVVNMLGAVTKNIVKREMMVIVEYCRYGNIQNFLLKNRKRFVNQINMETDLIDPTITSNDKRFSTDYEYNSQGLRYVHLVFPNHQSRNNNNSINKNKNNINNNTTSSTTTQSRRISENDPRSGTRPGRPNSQGYIRQSELYYASDVDSAMTQQTVVDGEEILSNNSVQPVWRSNYKADATSDTLEITTSDLVGWAFQVSRGMEYLASRKVLHGDLAARNILLCENNVVKICDFGLARSIIKNENYQKSEDARLPVKWLALESLGERIFSTRSDVWSFGIVLWEFFSLSKVPYPGIDANGGMLYEKLKDGYRMEKPLYANQELYEIMLECWRANPDSRPLFDELETRFARMLEEEVTNHYIDLNEHYLRINEEYQKTNPTDWIALMGSPSELAPPVPRYVNESIIPEIKIDSDKDYLKMSPKTGTAIFSPRPSSDDYVKATSNQFDFSRPISPTTSNNIDSPILKNRNKNNIIPEEIPMLGRQSYSDSEPEQSPSPRDIIKKFNSFSTNSNTNNSNNKLQNNNLTNNKKIAPSAPVGEQNKLPPISNQQSQNFINNDNYINVKTKPAPLATAEAFTNPSYLIIQNANEKKK